MNDTWVYGKKEFYEGIIGSQVQHRTAIPSAGVA